jgi:mono/diheme cytochrome c family protein
MKLRSEMHGTALLGVFVLVFAALGGAALCRTSFAEDGKDGQYAKKGRAIFVQYCVACHGSSGRGDGPVASSLKLPPSDLTNLAQKYNGFPLDKVVNWIDGEKASSAHGSREMPVWGKRFRDANRGQPSGFGEVYLLAKYIESMQKK